MAKIQRLRNPDLHWDSLGFWVDSNLSGPVQPKIITFYTLYYLIFIQN